MAFYVSYPTQLRLFDCCARSYFAIVELVA